MSRISSRAARAATVVALILFAPACSTEGDPAAPAPSPSDSLRLTTALRFTGLRSPVFLTHAPGDARLFIVEQPGRIRVVSDDGALLEAPYLDLTDRVGSGGERGLLSMAFHPAFSDNGFFFVSYTDPGGTSRVVRYTQAGTAADPESAVEILQQTQPFSNHNGGHLSFGPDGMLYFGLGDGGSAGDPQGNAQDAGNWLGALLRIDVDHPEPGRSYGIPPDNPFVGMPGARTEIWAYGLRNPWRFSFDPAENRIYVGDVGQNRREEVSAVQITPAAYNFGWNVKEGDTCYSRSPCDDPGFTDPVLAYDNPGEGCSVVGGYVYRGQDIPELVGTYLYSDYCSGWVKGFRLANGVAVDRRTWIESLGRVTSLGVDDRGEMYVLTSAGEVLQIVR